MRIDGIDCLVLFIRSCMLPPLPNRILKTLSIVQRRMCLTSLRYPDKIFVSDPPPPPPWPKTTSHPILASSSSLQWKESKRDNKTLTRVLSKLQNNLRSVHKRKIVWPSEESVSSKYVPILRNYMLIITSVVSLQVNI